MYKNKEWLYNKYINEELSTVQIADMFEVCANAISKWLVKYNIPRRSRAEATYLASGNHCELSESAINWINGEMLGDGHICSTSKYSAKFQYGSKYLEYIEYVRDTLKSFGIEQSGKIYKRINKKYGNTAYHYYSRAYPELLPIRKQWYPEGKKIVPRDIKLTPLTIRQWYIGDGSLAHDKYSKNIILATYGFLIKDVKWLINQLTKIKIKANRHKKNVKHISAYSVKDFLEYIGECPIECYLYKWNI